MNHDCKGVVKGLTRAGAKTSREIALSRRHVVTPSFLLDPFNAKSLTLSFNFSMTI